jgi:hypothetical protein
MVRAIASDTWFPEESQRMLLMLLDLWKASIHACFDLSKNQAENQEDLALALALPFVGRFSCSTPGDISTHTKLGGMCVYHDWDDDFHAYLHALGRRLEIIAETAVSLDHTVIYGDTRTLPIPRERFDGIFTSPPENEVRHYPSFQKHNIPPHHAWHAILYPDWKVSFPPIHWADIPVKNFAR